eukprot:TRINITY_DN45349_c0_g1_i1.p1 TRINITY_DN45349_c0_g1~~TRINITY_DN45349_c0_g1_i1.p1  ORF type:complete len:364 (-),score=96.98 TRINITY_DN45349_c0_g1_i1:50-1141(-)
MAHRLCMISLPNEDEGLVKQLLKDVEGQGLPSLRVTQSESVLVSEKDFEFTTKSSTKTHMYLLMTESHKQLDAVLQTARKLGVNSKGVLAVLGKGAMGSDKLSLEELRALIRRQSLGWSSHTSVFVAAVLAAVGLATDNDSSVVASMLVSPLMSPILQLSFAIADPVLRNEQGFKRRCFADFCLAVTLCYIVGFLAGVLSVLSGIEYSYSWPTSEMSARTHTKALAPGAVIALVSGLGVASGVRQGGVNALVGVAISAALLPPLVNSGMLLAWSWYSQKEDDFEKMIYWAEISSLLTVINVVGIILTAATFFRVKLGKALKNPVSGVEEIDDDDIPLPTAFTRRTVAEGMAAPLLSDTDDEKV